jgi:hypothetical protein
MKRHKKGHEMEVRAGTGTQKTEFWSRKNANIQICTGSTETFPSLGVAVAGKIQALLIISWAWQR